MKNPNDLTIKTYRECFKKYEARTPKEVKGEFARWMNSFASYLPKNGKILEIGSATGRDARYFALKGYKVTCTDIIPEALSKLANEGFETSEFDFRDEPKDEWKNKFDGFFANGVLIHTPKDVLIKVLLKTLKVLKKDGIVGFSLKIGEGEEITEVKIDAPRYFHYYKKKHLLKILSDLPFEIISVENSSDNVWLRTIIKVK